MSKILSMLNFLSQHIACDFEPSQLLWNVPSQLCSIVACGPGYSFHYLLRWSLLRWSLEILNLEFRAMHHMKAHQMAIAMMQTDWKSDNKKLRYPKIGSRNSNMLENLSQSIACYFIASQGLKYIPSWVCSIAACGWAL